MAYFGDPRNDFQGPRSISWSPYSSTQLHIFGDGPSMELKVWTMLGTGRDALRSKLSNNLWQGIVAHIYAFINAMQRYIGFRRGSHNQEIYAALA